MPESTVQVATGGTGPKLHTWQRTVGANNVEDEFTILGEYPLATYSVAAAAVSTVTAASHLLQIMAGGSLNVYVRRIWVSQNNMATAASSMRVQLIRLTSAGTGGSATTPAPYDTSDAASGATAMTLPTVKGTEGTSLRIDNFQLIQTAPVGGGPNGYALDFTGHHAKAIRIPAGATNGIAIKNVDAIAGAGLNVVVEIVEASF